MTSVEPPSGNERAYLEAYGEATAMPDAARDRVWARLSGGPLGPVGGEAANDPGVHEVVSRGGGWLARPGLWIAAAVAIVSGATVLGLLAGDRSDPQMGTSTVTVADRGSPRADEPEPPSVPVASRSAVELRPSLEPAPAPVDERSAPRAESKRVEPKPRSSVASRPEALRSQAQAAKPPPSSLADERRLIEQTHEALGRGETELALSLLRQHSRDYPGGVFVEEREALRAIATCTTGQLENGRAAANEFLASYPDAVLAARVRNSCALED